jgi:hypothetical protein
MAGFLGNLGFPHDKLSEFALLCSMVKHEGEIITTSVGNYYRLGLPVPDSDDFEIELWLREAYEGEGFSFRQHFVGACEGSVILTTALKEIAGQHYDGAFRCTHNQLIRIDDKLVRLPFVFDCPNFDCAENFVLPQEARVAFCGFAVDLTCYEDEATYLAESKLPPPAYMCPHDFLRDDKNYTTPFSPVAHISGWVDETAIITNPLTDCDFIWAVIDIGSLGLIDVVAAPADLKGFLHEGCVVRGTIRLSGRLVEW